MKITLKLNKERCQGSCLQTVTKKKSSKTAYASKEELSVIVDPVEAL
jgi:hypothetical protein